MSPSPEHEEFKEFIYSLARVISEESNLLLESRGSATFKQKDLLKGVEPDTCFYVQNAPEVIGKRKIDLAVDPPPDVVVEIDMTTDSFGKFKIFAAFEIAEVWRYDGHRAVMYQLVGGAYAEMDSSLAFPGFFSSALTEFIEQSKSHGQTAALSSFRAYWRAQIAV